MHEDSDRQPGGGTSRYSGDSQPNLFSRTGMNVLKDLELLHMLAKSEHSSWHSSWLNMILAYEAHQRAAGKQPEQEGVVHTPPKQK